MDAGQQKGEYRQKVMNDGSPFVVKDAPERHEPDKDCSRPLLS